MYYLIKHKRIFKFYILHENELKAFFAENSIFDYETVKKSDDIFDLFQEMEKLYV